MRSRAWGALAAPTAGGILVFLRWPHTTGRVVAIWILFVLGYVLVAFRRQIGRLILESTFDELMTTHTRKRERPEGLRRAERLFGWKTYSPRDFDYDVRPVLRELIAARVANKIGASVTEDAAQAHPPLDPELMALGGSEPGEKLYSQPLRTTDLVRMVTKLEEL